MADLAKESVPIFLVNTLEESPLCNVQSITGQSASLFTLQAALPVTGEKEWAPL